MTWNYRIVKRLDGGYALHEVYYNAETANGMTKYPTDFVCDLEEGPEGIVKSLEMALKDAKTRPVFDEAEAEWVTRERNNAPVAQ